MRHNNVIMVLGVGGELFLKSMCILLFLESILSIPLCGRLISSCRDHPQRGNLHGRGHCWPVLRTLQPCWCYVLLQEGMWGSCRRRSHLTVLLWGAGVGILFSRTNANLHHVSRQLSVVCVIEILIRYCLLMPFQWARRNLLGSVFHITF